MVLDVRKEGRLDRVWAPGRRGEQPRRRPDPHGVARPLTTRPTGALFSGRNLVDQLDAIADIDLAVDVVEVVGDGSMRDA
jgi:hypothetical protein